MVYIILSAVYLLYMRLSLTSVLLLCSLLYMLQQECKDSSPSMLVIISTDVMWTMWPCKQLPSSLIMLKMFSLKDWYVPIYIWNMIKDLLYNVPYFQVAVTASDFKIECIKRTERLRTESQNVKQCSHFNICSIITFYLLIINICLLSITWWYSRECGNIVAIMPSHW